MAEMEHAEQARDFLVAAHHVGDPDPGVEAGEGRADQGNQDADRED
jgi:hypothetical protein